MRLSHTVFISVITEEDLLEVLALLKEKKRRKREAELGDVSARHADGDTRRREGDIRLRLGRRGGGERRERSVNSRTPSPVTPQRDSEQSDKGR